MKRARVARVAVLLAVLLAIAACGATHRAAGDQIPGRVLRIYSSVPLQGASSVDGEAVMRGARMALDRVRGRIGKYRVVLQSLDDATAARRTWDQGQTTQNARQVVADRTTIGYLGELDSGASAISIPLLNKAGIPQISPASTAVGLTSNAAGASPGEPQKYYPTGRRTFARVVPSDAIQAVAEVRLQQSLGCTGTYVLDDGEVDGLDNATSFDVAAQSAGLRVPATQAFDPNANDYTALASTVARSGANCVLISAITENHAVLITQQIAAAVPGVRIFGSAGLAESTYTDPAQGGIPYALDPRVLITVATLDPSAYPYPAQAFFARYSELYGMPQPYAIYGYEAMSLMLAAINRATGEGRHPAQRSKVVAAIFATRNRRSVLGTYTIDRNGDTNVTRYGVYRVLAGRLTFWKAIDG
ncbi:MAG: branched-chain amino acid ABC transporter substrate-binding protein [Solirubrobacteraceae bacterium]